MEIPNPMKYFQNGSAYYLCIYDMCTVQINISYVFSKWVILIAKYNAWTPQTLEWKLVKHKSIKQNIR